MLFDVSFPVPEHVRRTVGRTEEGRAWIEHLPTLVERFTRQWDLELASVIGHDGTSALVVGARRGGEPVVLKIGWPHYEARDEIEGLRTWAGEAIVELRAFDRDENVLLLERCEPGTSLRSAPAAEQDRVVASILRRLWAVREAQGPFRPLSGMIRAWAAESRAAQEVWPDRALAERGLEAYEVLCRESRESTLLATDLHAGNVLRAEREPWLAIDPKPYRGERSYDATQHLLNCRDRLAHDPARTIVEFAKLLDVDPRRVGAWLFARLATESGDRPAQQALARRLDQSGFGPVC